MQEKNFNAFLKLLNLYDSNKIREKDYKQFQKACNQLGFNYEQYVLLANKFELDRFL